MLTLQVALAERSYPILIGQSLLADGALLARHLPARDLLLVSNTTVAPLYAERVRASLPDRRIVDVRLPEETIAAIDAQLGEQFDRQDCPIATVLGDVRFHLWYGAASAWVCPTNHPFQALYLGANPDR